MTLRNFRGRGGGSPTLRQATVEGVSHAVGPSRGGTGGEQSGQTGRGAAGQAGVRPGGRDGADFQAVGRGGRRRGGRGREADLAAMSLTGKIFSSPEGI